jgi:hypothetical protein
VPALAALVAGAAVAVALAGTIPGGRSGGPRPAISTQREASAAVVHKRPAPPPKPATTTTTAPTTVTVTPAAATTPPPVSETLEARGHELMLNGEYAAAIPVLRQAVGASSPGSPNYAYALYDLGRSLRLVGDPKDAARVLYQRLQIPNQTETVRVQLQLALQALGRQARGSGGAAAGPRRHGHRHGGGAGDPGGGPGLAGGGGVDGSGTGA